MTLRGFNFGAAAADVSALTVNGVACDNVVHYSSSQITCVLSQPGATNKHADAGAGSTPVAAARTQHANSSEVANDKWFSHRDVELTTTSGRALGIHNQVSLCLCYVMYLCLPFFCFTSLLPMLSIPLI